MRLPISLSLACLVSVLVASSAATVDTLVIEEAHRALPHLLVPQPVIATGWSDWTKDSERQDSWWFRLHVDKTGRVARADLESGRTELRQEATRAALALRFRPFTVNGKPVPAEFDFLVNQSEADYAGPQDRSFPAQVDPREVSVALRRKSCYGACPSYRVEVRGDGLVTYEGMDDVAVEGEHQWRIDPAVAAQLIEKLRKADYFRLDGVYAADITDNPAYITRVIVGDRRKNVFDYAGHLLEAPDKPMPLVVTELERAIDALSGVSGWVKGDEHTMARLRAEKWDFHSAVAGRSLNQIVGFCKIALAKDFIHAGAPIGELRSHRQESALIRSAECGDVELVRLLVSRGAFARKGEAQDFLARAVWAGYPDLVRIALTQPVDVNRRNEYGEPLIFNLAGGRYRDEEEGPRLPEPDHVEVLRQLVAAGADPGALDRSDKSLLDMTTSETLALALLDAGVKLPSDPERLADLVERAKNYKWGRLLPRFKQACAAAKACARSMP